MDYFTSLLGNVAAFGVRADHAARDVVERTAEEFALLVCQKTGISYDFLTDLKKEVVERVTSGAPVPALATCKGRTKMGVPCKKKVLRGYCESHRNQEDLIAAKRRRVDAHLARRTNRETIESRADDMANDMIRPAKFNFI